MLSGNDQDDFSAILLRSKKLLSLKKYQDALDVLTLIQEDVDNFAKLSGDKLLIFYNNISVLYYNLGKPNLGSFYMNKAQDVYFFHLFNCYSEKFTIGQYQGFSSDTIYKFMYNVGLRFHFASEPIDAFYFFRKAAQGLTRSSLVWLRLAECCIMAYNKNDVEKKTCVARGKVGMGMLSKIVLNSEIYKDASFNSSDSQSFEGKVPSLAFATICLKNAYLFLPPDNNRLKQAVLAASCYVQLTIGGFAVATKHARMLLENSTSCYEYMSKMYLAEALLKQNRNDEAIEVLKQILTSEWMSSEDSKYWFTNIDVSSGVLLIYNISVALVRDGHFQKAYELIGDMQKLEDAKKPLPVQIIALGLYIQVALGRTDAAKEIIKECCPHIF